MAWFLRALPLSVALALVAGCGGDGSKQADKPAGEDKKAGAEKPAEGGGAEVARRPEPAEILGEEAGALDLMLAADFDAGMREYERLMTERRAEPVAEYYWQRFMDAADLADDDVTDEIVEAAERVLAKGGCHPLFEARMREYRMMVWRGKGKLAEAEKEAEALGFVRDWFVCGPFDNESETGYKAAYGPEKEFSLEKEYEGKHGKNRFFRSAARARFGTVDMSELFRLTADVCGYAAAVVKSDETRAVAVRVGSDGATKVWVNGKAAIESDSYRRAGFDQDAAGAVLEKGWNVILVKVCQKGGGEDTKGLVDFTWEFELRLTQPDGRPLTGWSAEADLAKAAAARYADPSGASPAAVDTGARGWLVEAVKAGPEDAFSRARLGFLLGRRHDLDENDRSARDLLRAAVKLEPDVAIFRLWLAEAEDAKNRKLEHLHKAIELAPGSALALWSEAEQHAGYIDDKALWRYKAALEKKPGLVIVRMSMAELYARRQGLWVNEARRIYQEIIKQFPGHGVAQSALARLGEPPPGEAIAYLEGRLASWGLDSVVRAQLVSLYRRTGEFDKAVALLDRKLELEPFDVGAHLLAAAIHESRERWDDAMARYRAALAISPENNAALLGAANCAIAAGRNEEAIEHLSMSLALRPNQPDASKRLRSLKPKEREFWRGYEVDLKPHIDAAKSAQRQGDEPATYVFKHDVIVVADNGTSKLYTQQVIKIHDERGATSYRFVSALGGNFDTFGGGRAEFKTAKRIRPDGTEIEGRRREGAWSAGFDNLSAGDILVLEFQMEEAGEARYKGYFGLLLPLQPEYDPVSAARVTFVHGEKKEVNAQAVGFSAQPTVSKENGMLVTVWEVQGIPQVTQEPHMPPFWENVPYLHFSTFKTWQDVGDWFGGLVKDQLESSDEIRDAVKAAVAGATSRKEKIEALYQLLVSRTRYEALNLENHAYLPFKASETFARKYGDCKDTATLFVTMMKEAGEPAHLVLVRTNDMGVIDTSLPSMKVFNHCIAWVPDAGDGRSMFIDGTARYYGARDLPTMDQGAVMFVVKKDSSAAEIAEWLPPEFNTRDTAIVVRVNADGSADVTQEGTVTGVEAGQMRQRFQEGSDRRKLFAEWYNRYFDSVEVRKLTFSDLSAYNLPVTYKAEIHIPRFARKDGRSIAFRPAMFPEKLAEEFGGMTDRKHDVMLDWPRVRKEKVTFELPGGWKVKETPKAVERSNAVGSFKWGAKADGNRIAVESEFSIKQSRVPKADYREFREFALTVDKAEEEEVVIEPEK